MLNDCLKTISQSGVERFKIDIAYDCALRIVALLRPNSYELTFFDAHYFSRAHVVGTRSK